MTRKLLGPEHPHVSISLHNLANVLLVQGKPGEAEPRFREALALDRKLLGNEHPEVASSLTRLAMALADQNQWPEAERLFTDALTPEVQKQPRIAASLLDARGDFHANTGRWKEAAADFAAALQFEPADLSAHFSLGPVLVQTRELEDYRRHCARLLEGVRGTKNPFVAEGAAKVCLFLPDAGVDLAAVAAGTDTAVKEGTNHSAFAWFAFAKGLAEYRQGRFSSAGEWMKKVLAQEGDELARDAQAYLTLAMALHQLKQTSEARKALTKGAEIVNTKLPKLARVNRGNYWTNFILAQTLLREAEALITPSNGSGARDRQP